MNHLNHAVTRDQLVRSGIHDHAPRFSNLATCIRAGLYGVDALDTQHMIERNIAVDQERQLHGINPPNNKVGMA